MGGRILFALYLVAPMVALVYFAALGLGHR
jgi:hypothetical protein